MRRMIDAHAHLRPAGIAGTVNRQFNVEYKKYGALTLNGTWTIQGMPEYCVDSEFTDDTLIHVMDAYGIERAVLMTAASSDLEVNRMAVEKYPDRLTAAMYVMYEDDIDKQILEKYRQNFRVIKFETSTVLGYTHPSMYPNFKFNSGIMKKAYHVCAAKNIPIAIDPGKPFSPGYQVEELDEAIREFSDVHFIICHLGVPEYPHTDGSPDDIRWRQMLDLAKYPNVWFDVCAMPNLFKEEEYPYATAMKYVREFADRYGKEKIIWGTDVPTTYVNCTFRQMINVFERCPLFTEEEKDLLFYDNAVRAYFL